MPEFKERVYTDLVEAYGQDALPEFEVFSKRLSEDENYAKGVFTNIKTAYGDQYELSKLGESKFLSEVKKKVVSEPSGQDFGTQKSKSSGEPLVLKSAQDKEQQPQTFGEIGGAPKPKVEKPVFPQGEEAAKTDTTGQPEFKPLSPEKTEVLAETKPLQIGEGLKIAKQNVDRSRNIAKQHLREGEAMLQGIENEVKQLQQLYANESAPAQDRKAAKDRLQLLSDQYNQVAEQYKVDASDYMKTFDDEALLQTEKNTLEKMRQQKAEREFSLVRDGIDKFAKASVNTLTGIGSIMNTLGFGGDTESGDVFENEQVQAEIRDNAENIDKWSETLISQETPENFKRVFRGDFSPKKLAYIVENALAQTAPTVIAGIVTGGVGATVSGAGLGYSESYSVMREAGLDQKQASIAATGMAIPLGLLESYGMGDVIKAFTSPMIKRKIAAEVVAKLGTKELAEEQVFQATKNTTTQFVKDYLKALSKTAVKEPLTESEQAIFTEVSKQVAESYTGKDSNKDQSLTQYLAEVGESVAEEAVAGLAGGVAFGVIGAAQESRNKFTETGYEKAMELKNPEAMKDFVEAVKSEVGRGIITQEQADMALNNIAVMQEVDNKIPSTISGMERRTQVANLLFEKQVAEQDIEGKDEALVGPQKKRVEEINTELKNIAEGKTEEVVEPTAVEEVVVGETAQTEVEQGNKVEEVAATGEEVVVEMPTKTKQTERTSQQIREEADTLKSENEKFFTKTGVLRKNAPQELQGKVSTLKQEFEQAVKKEREKHYDELEKLSKEGKELSRAETEKLNKEFEDRQTELAKSFGLTEEEIITGRIEDKIEFGEALTPEEVQFANENFFIAKGFEYTEQGLTPTETEKEENKVSTQSLNNEKVENKETPKALSSVEETAKALESVDKSNFEGFKKMRVIDGLLYVHEKTSDPTLDYIRVFKNNKEVAHLFFGEEKKGDGVLKGGVQVDENLQKKGIASKMYEMAEQVSGMKFIPDTPHSKSAEKLWASSSRRFGNDKSGVSIEQSISEAYHKAKADGSNPELVKAVEELINKQDAKEQQSRSVRTEGKRDQTQRTGDSNMPEVNGTELQNREEEVTAKPEAEEEGKQTPQRDEKANQEGEKGRQELLSTEEGMKEAPPASETDVEAAKDRAGKRIDEAAEWLKQRLKVDLPEGTKKSGIGQDDIIDLVAKAVKALVNTGIEVNAAIQSVIKELREGGFMEGIDETDVVNKVSAEYKTEPEKQMRRYSRQVIREFPALEGIMSDEGLYYNTLPNKTALAEANGLIDYLGEEEARKAYTDINNGISGAVRTVIGMALLKRYQERGDYESAVDIAEEVAKRGTELGREIQAFSMFSALSPEGFLISTQRVVNQAGERRAKQDKKRTDKMKKGLEKANKEAVDTVLESETVKKKIKEKQKIEPKPTVRDSSYGKNNKIVTKTRYEELKKQLRGKFFSSPVTPELIELGIYHVEAGARTFAEFSKNVIDDLGNKVKPYLKGMYLGAREQLGSEGFSTDEEIARAEAEEAGQALVKQIETAIRTRNRKAMKAAISKLQDVAKQTGLWGKYKDLAVQRLKTLTSQGIKTDIEESAVLDDFTKGLVKNIRQQIQEQQPKTEQKQKEQRTAIEIIADAYKNFEKYEEVWNKTVEEFRAANAGNPEVLEQLDAYYGDLTPKPFSEKLVEQAVRQGLKEMNVSIADVVKQHYTVYDYTLRTLTDKLVEQSGLDRQEAQELADAIQKEFDKIATEKKRQALEKIFSKSERKKPEVKSLESEIIRLTNLGAFSDAELLKVWADKMGYPKLTAENIQEIQRLANAVQENVDGFKKFRAVEDLLAYQSNLKGISPVDVGVAIWYANILSGFTTQEVNLVANMINSALLYASAVAQNPTQAKFIGTGFIEGLKRGWLEGRETFRTGYSPIRGKVEVPNVLERKNFTGWGKPLNYWKYVARTMKAADVLVFEALKEMRAYQLAVKEAGKNPELLEPNQSIRDKAAQLVGATSGQLEAAQAEADLEYEQVVEEINSKELTAEERKDALKQAKSDRDRRVYEILEQERSETIQKDSAVYASRGTYNYKPEGALGWMASSMNMAKDALERTAQDSESKAGRAAAQALKVLVNSVIPFTNIIANVANENLNYTPWGALRAAMGQSTVTGYNTKVFTKEEKVDAYTKSIMGTTLLVALYALSESWGEDEQPLIEITANGHGNYRKNYDLQNSGWQPYSVRVGKTWYSYQYSPLMIPLSFLGNIKDYEKYRGEKMADKGMSDLVAVSGAATMRSLLDMTFLSSLNTFLSAAMDPRNEDAASDFFEASKKTAMSVALPNIYTQTAKEIENKFSIPVKEIRGTYAGAILQHVPIARDQYFDKINGLGETIVPDTDKLISFGKDDKLWNMIAEKGASINVPTQKMLNIYDPTTQEMRAYTAEEYYEFSKARGAYLKELLNVNYEELNKLESKDFKEWLSKANTNANKVGKYRVWEKLATSK